MSERDKGNVCIHKKNIHQDVIMEDVSLNTNIYESTTRMCQCPLVSHVCVWLENFNLKF